MLLFIILPNFYCKLGGYTPESESKEEPTYELIALPKNRKRGRQCSELCTVPRNVLSSQNYQCLCFHSYSIELVSPKSKFSKKTFPIITLIYINILIIKQLNAYQII